MPPIAEATSNDYFKHHDDDKDNHRCPIDRGGVNKRGQIASQKAEKWLGGLFNKNDQGVVRIRIDPRHNGRNSDNHSVNIASQ